MKRIECLLLLTVLLLTGCGVSKEDIGAVCAERDALRKELRELQEQREAGENCVFEVEMLSFEEISREEYEAYES